MRLKGGFPFTIGLLFAPGELTSHVATGEEADRWEHWVDDDDNVIYEFVVHAAAARDRLNLLGVGRESLESELARVNAERLEHLKGFASRSDADPEMQTWINEEVEKLRQLDLDTWIARAAYDFAKRDAEYTDALAHLGAPWEESDPLIAVRAFLEALPEVEEIRVDVSDFVEYEELNATTDPRELALSYLSTDLAHRTPVVILTEGPTDARVLEAAVEILKPHLTGYLRFPDFTIRPESNAAALVRTLKTFAAAGIRNRVIALFDNDTAAEDAVVSLNDIRLPPNIKYMRLPPLPLAISYPTLGPSGPVTMDVNGLAGGIELYLGDEVLKDDQGNLRPVQWKGRVERLNRYQGEITQKLAVQAAFDRKVDAARSSHDRGSGDWSGLELILNAILELLAGEPPGHL